MNTTSTGEKSTTQSNRQPHHRWAPMYALILALVLLWFSPWLIEGKVLAPFDIVTQLMQPWRGSIQIPRVKNHFVTDGVTQFIPYQMFVDKSLREDGYIGWNPMVFGGFAQYADTSGLYFDWSIELHRFLGFWQAWHLGLMAQFLIAGFGMLAFLRRRNLSPPLALTAALAYLGNWQFVAWIYCRGALGCFCWMPWVLWALYRWRAGKTAVFIPVFLGLAFLGGTLQQAAFVIIATTCIWAGWLWQQRRDWRVSSLLTLHFLLWGLLAAGLTAFMFKPTLASFLENQLSQPRSLSAFYGGLRGSLLNLLSYPFYAFPTLLGSTETLDLGHLFNTGIINYGFFGTLPVLCAALAFFSKRIPLEAKLLMAAGLLLPLTPLVGLLYHRVNLLWILGGCWAGAEFLNGLSEAEIRRLASRLGRLFATLIALWLLASLAIQLAEPALQAKLKALVLASNGGQFGDLRGWLALRAEHFTGYLKIWNPVQLASLLTTLLSLLGLRLLAGKSRLLAHVLPLGVALQLTLFWFTWTTWSTEKNPYPKNETAAAFQKLIGNGRLAISETEPQKRLFPANTLDPLGIATTDGYDSIHPRQMANPTGNPWDFPGTTHYLCRQDQPRPEDWECVWQARGWQLFKNPRPGIAEATCPLALNKNETGTLSTTASLTRPTLNTMEVEAPRGAARLTVYENYHRGWHWRLANSPTGAWHPTQATPGHALGIDFHQPLPAPATVELRFRPTLPPWILAIESISLLGLLFLLTPKSSSGSILHFRNS